MNMLEISVLGNAVRCQPTGERARKERQERGAPEHWK